MQWVLYFIFFFFKKVKACDGPSVPVLIITVEEPNAVLPVRQRIWVLPR